MPLVSSNTYTEPTAGTSLNGARLQQNDSYRSLLTNFKSPAIPTTVNITVAGVNVGEQDGMLYRSATTNALYISDTVHKKNSPVGGNFTRVGIGNRVENGIVALGANATSYEIGELVATVSEDGILSSNARLYLCVSNTASAGSTTSFIDVGLPQGYSVGVLNNVTFTGQSATAQRFIATSNIAINTTSPSECLHVVGNANIQSSGFITVPTGTTAQRPASTQVGMIRFNSSYGKLESYSGAAWANVGGVMTTSESSTDASYFPLFSSAAGVDIEQMYTASGKLHFNPSTGTLNSTIFNSLSDVRVKSNIRTIDNALAKVNQMRGTYFTIESIPSVGVIAQEIETILPEVVSGTDTKSVAYGNIVGILIEAIKELSQEVDKLSKEIERYAS